MLIDWFTIIAQIVNFLILVYLLKRFLYKPILKAIDEREKRIATQIEEAAKQKKEAEEQHQKFQQLKEELNKNKESLMQKAKKEAEEAQLKLMEKAQKEYDELHTSLVESLEKEQSEMELGLKKRVQQEVFEIARKTMSELAETSLETQIIKVFIQKLNGLSKAEKTRLTAAFQPSKNPLIVQSTFDISKDQQLEIETAIKSNFGKETTIECTLSEDSISGIELHANGSKIAWNIAEYLDGIEKQVSEFSKDSKTKDSKAKDSKTNPAKPENVSHEK